MLKGKQDGYALLTVLLMIVIFMIIILAFMGRAFSSVKQTQIVEKSTQSVSLAEMGITYYQVAVQNIYKTNLVSVTDEVKTQITSDRRTGLKSNDYYVNLAVSKMKDKIENGLKLEKTSVSIDGRSSSSFSLDSVNYFRGTTPERKILITVNGIENGKITKLSSEMNFSPTISGLSSSGSTSGPSYSTISVPINTDPYYCLNPNTFSNCQNISITVTPKTFTDKLNNTASTTIYSSGTLTLDPSNNANNLNNVNIHTEGSLTIGGNVQNASSVVLEVKGGLTVIGQFTLLSGTTVWVNGNVTVTKQLTLGSGSKMCVGGTIDASKIKNKGGTLIYKGSSDWSSKCGTPTETTVDWGDQVYNNVNYDY